SAGEGVIRVRPTWVRDNGFVSDRPVDELDLDLLASDLVASAGSGRVVDIGTDLVELDRFRTTLERTPSIVERLFTEGERAYALKRNDPTERFAARFAAKDAALKVLRLTDQSFSWRSIEVARNPGGWCYIVLHGPMRHLADQAGFVAFSLSMTHEGAYAQAVVIGQRRKRSGEESKKPSLSS
ncbi:MAG: 4'-phosphopantetheinyl transferase superfamily protein, partial [Polyangiaceae bacterium]